MSLVQEFLWKINCVKIERTVVVAIQSTFLNCNDCFSDGRTACRTAFVRNLSRILGHRYFLNKRNVWFVGKSFDVFWTDGQVLVFCPRTNLLYPKILNGACFQKLFSLDLVELFLFVHPCPLTHLKMKPIKSIHKVLVSVEKNHVNNSSIRLCMIASKHNETSWNWAHPHKIIWSL